MSSPFNLNQSSTDHLRDRQQERLLAWAESVFAEPKPDGYEINPRLYELGYISQEQEIHGGKAMPTRLRICDSCRRSTRQSSHCNTFTP